jgi:cellulose synthase/poly-beta-1,6-N-acetylglucosamine synthase-like glycosyltransferase
MLKKEGINGLSNRIRTQLSLHSASRNILHIQNHDEIVPKVSIIIPVFNALSLTQECIRSLSGDTHNIECEIIVVDNASIDNIPNWLREESKKNASLRIDIIGNSDKIGEC